MMRGRLAGFTLIELLLVMGIIVLLTALFIPAVGAVVTVVKVRDSEHRLTVIHGAVMDYHRAYNAYPPSTSPDPGGMRPDDDDSYPPYRYPDGTEAEYLFKHGTNLAHPFGGKFLAYFLLGPNGIGWHRPKSRNNPADQDYRNRFITAEWDPPDSLMAYLANSPQGVNAGDRAGAGSKPMRCPSFVDAFGIHRKTGGLIGYIAANPRLTGPARWKEDGLGHRNDALTWVYYEDCSRDEAAARTTPRGYDHLARTLEDCPHGFALISPGSNQRFGYCVYGKEVKGKCYRRWFADLAQGITDDMTNYPLE